MILSIVILCPATRAPLLVNNKIQQHALNKFNKHEKWNNKQMQRQI